MAAGRPCLLPHLADRLQEGSPLAAFGPARRRRFGGRHGPIDVTGRRLPRAVRRGRERRQASWREKCQRWAGGLVAHADGPALPARAVACCPALSPRRTTARGGRVVQYPVAPGVAIDPDNVSGTRSSRKPGRKGHSLEILTTCGNGRRTGSAGLAPAATAGGPRRVAP